MKFFLDTEFNQNGTFVEMISIGLVSGDGREYYAQNADMDWKMVQPFVEEHVLPLFDNSSWFGIKKIRDDVTAFIDPTKGPHEIWAWYGNYDWVAFCGTIYGNMVAVPEGMPWNIMDLKQYADYLRITTKPAPPVGEHNALVDARWNRDYYKYLRKYDHEQRLKEKRLYHEGALLKDVPFGLQM